MTSVTQMHGKTLTFARSAWLGIALLDVGLFVVGLIIWLPLLQQPCTEAAVVCLQRGQVTTAEFAAVSATGCTGRTGCSCGGGAHERPSPGRLLRRNANKK